MGSTGNVGTVYILLREFVNLIPEAGPCPLRNSRLSDVNIEERVIDQVVRREADRAIRRLDRERQLCLDGLIPLDRVDIRLYWLNLDDDPFENRTSPTGPSESSGFARVVGLVKTAGRNEPDGI